MKYQKPLSELHGSYTKGKLSKREFEGSLFQYLLGNHDRYRLFDGDRERWNEYLSWLYPRLARAVDLYQEQGASFDTYITSLVHRSSKEYRCREADRRMTEYICWQAKAEEMNVRESESEYYEGLKKISVPEGIKPRQILILLLKSYYFVTGEHIEKVAAAVGMTSEMVQNMVDELKKRRSERETAILNLRDRLHCQHYRCLAYQKRMIAAQPGTEYYEKMKVRFQRAKRRFFAMKKRLAGIRLVASNRMVAELMGIPKGTVDSSLFAVRNHPAFSAKRAEP